MKRNVVTLLLHNVTIVYKELVPKGFHQPADRCDAETEMRKPFISNLLHHLVLLAHELGL